MTNINPTREGFAAFRALPDTGPIHMLNLVRVRAIADYPADHPDHGKGLTGLQAYQAYGRESFAIFMRVGGRQIWSGRPDFVLTGPADERWDFAFIAEYPSAAAFIEMVRDETYRVVVAHRTAAVEDSRLIRMAPLNPGKGFGEAD
jgi:uncharacterized protein (DUF1330 family)